MRTIKSCHALGICAAIGMFAGCSGSQTPISTPGVNAAMPGSVRAWPTTGGGFTGAYSGRYHYESCSHHQPGGILKFRGNGQASFLGSSHEIGVLSASYSSDGHCFWNGSVILISKKNRRDTISAYFSGGYGNPCGLQFSYTISGGRGKFGGATGSGNVSFTCLGKHKQSDNWSGDLFY